MPPRSERRAINAGPNAPVDLAVNQLINIPAAALIGGPINLTIALPEGCSVIPRLRRLGLAAQSLPKMITRISAGPEQLCQEIGIMVVEPAKLFARPRQRV